MFNRQRYHKAFKNLKTFKKSSSTCIQIELTEKEASRLQKKWRFRKLVFRFNDKQISEIKKWVIFKP